MKQTLPKLISLACAKIDQDVRYDEVLEQDGHRLRVRIRSNSYAFQSWAHVEHWSAGAWVEVHSLIPTTMKTTHGLYVREGGADKSHFREDRDELLRVARHILDIGSTS